MRTKARILAVAVMAALGMQAAGAMAERAVEAPNLAQIEEHVMKAREKADERDKALAEKEQVDALVKRYRSAGPDQAMAEMDWQARRARTNEAIRMIRDIEVNDPEMEKQASKDAMDTYLKATAQMGELIFTPLETLDLLAMQFRSPDVFETEKGRIFLAHAVAQITLGTYDIVRFTSQEVSEKIVCEENYFNAFIAIGGKRIADAYMDLLARKPEVARAAVMNGLRQAEILRGKIRYDVRWPMAYSRGSAGETLPESQWDQAFELAKGETISFFIEMPSARLPAGKGAR